MQIQPINLQHKKQLKVVKISKIQKLNYLENLFLVNHWYNHDINGKVRNFEGP